MANPDRRLVLGLVADDLTGAADSAAGFAEQGWRVVLSLRPGRPIMPTVDEPTVLAVSTESRAASNAAALTARAVEDVLAEGAERLFLKIDSAVRGSVASQIDGALTAWSQRHKDARAVICPAFPAQRRTVASGQVLVDGLPVGESVAARDPVTPRTISDLTSIVPGAVRRKMSELSSSTGPTKLVIDATDDADLDRLAAALTGAGPELIMVGSGGLSAALGRAWSRPSAPVTAVGVDGRLLIAVSSLHPVTASQLERLRSRSAATGLDVLTTRAELTTSTAAAHELAGRVSAALASRPYAALVIVGGDGAAAILSAVAAESITIDGAIIPGCPTGIVAGGSAEGLRVVTKSGGFGDHGALIAIVDRLRAPDGQPLSDQDQAKLRLTQKESR